MKPLKTFTPSSRASGRRRNGWPALPPTCKNTRLVHLSGVVGGLGPHGLQPACTPRDMPGVSVVLLCAAYLDLTFNFKLLTAVEKLV